MKLEYIGHAPRFSMRYPIGARKRDTEKIITVTKSEPTLELPDDQGMKLLELDSEILGLEKLTGPQAQEYKDYSDRFEDLGDGLVRRHRNFVRALDDLGKGLVERESHEAPVKKKRGRPRKKKVAVAEGSD